MSIDRLKELFSRHENIYFAFYATSKSDESSASLYECNTEFTDIGVDKSVPSGPHFNDTPLCSSCSFLRRSCSSRFCLRHLARRFLNQTWKKYVAINILLSYGKSYKLMVLSTSLCMDRFAFAQWKSKHHCNCGFF